MAIRVRRVLEHYEAQSGEEAIAEDEVAYESATDAVTVLPADLVPVVCNLIAKRRSA